MRRAFTAHLLTLFLACACVDLKGGGDQCALRVIVKSPSGKRLQAAVKLIRHDGKVETTRTDEKGEIRFCDIGILPVRLEVGDRPKGCGTVVVENLRIPYGQRKTLQVTYSPCWLDGEPLPGSGCQYLIRVSDGGRGISRLKLERGGVLENERPDKFGRVLLNLARNTETVLIIERSGASEIRQEFKCANSTEDFEIELQP